MQIGYIGLGSLGGPIARRLAASGYAMTVHDVMPEAMAALADTGATLAEDPLDVARMSDVLCLCVRTDQDVLDVVKQGALFDALGRNGVLVIHSTISPRLCMTLDELAKPYDVEIVDCGVSGGAPAVAEGKLSIFVGGSDEAVNKVRPMLECLGSCNHLGPVGRGMQGKLLNNLISIASYGLAAHILDLGEHLGFDRETLHRSLMAGSAQSFALRVVPGFVQPERAGNLRSLFAKDIDHCRSLADADLPAMQALLPAAQSMIELLARREARS